MKIEFISLDLTMGYNSLKLIKYVYFNTSKKDCI